MTRKVSESGWFWLMKGKFIACLAFYPLILLAQDINAQVNKGFVWYGSLPTEDRIKALINSMTPEEKISQLVDESREISRLGIPRYGWWNECLHGVSRTGRATIFPQAIGLVHSGPVAVRHEFDARVSQKDL